MPGRIAAPPQPQIFNPDALEQIYAKQTFAGDPTQSGLAYAFLKNAQGNREDSQASYLSSLAQANALNAAMEAQDQSNDLAKVQMTQGVEAADKLGIPLDAMKAFQLLVSDPAKAGAVAGLTTDKMRATIAKLQAEANRANSAGANSGPSIATTYTITPLSVDVKMQGKNGMQPSEELIERHRAMSKRLSDRQRTDYSDEFRRQYRMSMQDRESRD